MKERRKAQRLPYHAVLTVDEVYNQDEVIKESREIPIEALDISKGGIGFVAKESLPLDYYFNAKIDLGNSRQFYSVLKIVRKDQQEDGYVYGCEFTGLADILSLYIDEFYEEITKE
jgi:c-di-GMP-binding flagellar brake protein YcgR